jgi:hypothetical protein
MEEFLKTDGIVCEDVEWIQLAQDGNQWRALVNTVMNLRVHKGRGIWLAEGLSASEEDFTSWSKLMENLYINQEANNE